MPPRIPTESDFSHLISSELSYVLHFPSPRESTTSFLILFHGLGDHEAPFGTFAKNLNLPGVLAISVRGTSMLPASLLLDVVVDGSGSGSGRVASHFHWADDLIMDSMTGTLESSDDPGYEKATRKVMDDLIRGTLIDKLGWEMRDVMLFGYGQGGSFALGLASQARMGERVVEEAVKSSDSDAVAKTAFKGAISLGGPLPISTIPTLSSRPKSDTSVLLCQLPDEHVDLAKREFKDVRVLRWKRREIGMPENREEMFPIMQFIAERLRSGW